jgi:serine/threonine-protein kinase ATR
MGVTGPEGKSWSFKKKKASADQCVGAFRVACEISMKLLRENKDTLRSVLDAFVHDPLVEWQDERRKQVGAEMCARVTFNQKVPQENRQRRGRGAAGVHPTDNKLVANADLIKLALHALAPIEKKLQGFHPSSRDKECTTNHLVHILIQEATDPRNLVRD